MLNSDPRFWTQFARTHEDEWCRALSLLLRYDTVSGNTEPRAYRYWRSRIAEGFEFLHGLAREKGLVTRYYHERVLVIEMPGPTGAPVLGFPIHLDVVPAGEGWTRPPFGGQISDGAIWGRGAQDDKGPIIQVLFGLLGAMDLARSSNSGFRKTVRIMIFSEEEVGQWDDIPFYFEREKPPDFSIVPDAEFPITNGEKGFVNLRVRFEWSPPIKDGFEIQAGERANVVPAKAILRLDSKLLDGLDDPEKLAASLTNAPRKPAIQTENRTLTAEFHGVGAHGSLPHKGHNAATDALAAAAALPSLKDHPAARVFDWLARASAALDGSFLGIAHSHDKVGKTTVNLGILNAGANVAEAILNIRNPIGLSCAEVGARIAKLAADLKSSAPGITLAEVSSDRDGREPIYVDPDQFAKWINPMRRAYRDATGREADLQS
ncbi:Sapep family Mn(2+)-dependent dipeptidase, partial [Candidatus Sumerlaeota bacterium]|nr:Sapep family Mn(2+)-dependent dipeptidase [Candidatus Sumerlaeota bacterium]